jgi:hypothetical protein
MNVQFDWWLLIVGFVLGAGLTGLVLAELRRREDDVTAREREAEAAWIASDLTAHGIPADAEAVAEVLRLHRLYLASLPADEPELDKLDEFDAEAVPSRDGDGAPVGPAPDTREDARTLS